MKKQNGITLIALVITIIILLILAGITIASLQNSGMFGKSKNAVNSYKNSENEEQVRLNEYENTMNEYID